MRSVLLLAVVAGTLPQLRGADTTSPYSFHHLHLNDSSAPFRLQFYERMFDPATTRRTTVGGVDGLQSGPMLVLISRASSQRPQPTALWHFGWGEVSLGETYLAHARREVAWEPPLPAERLHVHLLSVTPAAAGAWYRDVLGVRVELASTRRTARRELPAPEHRMPEALVWIGNTGLTIYPADPPLVSSRGQESDHIALGCADLDAALMRLRSHKVVVLAEPTITSGLRTAMIEGPDRLAIELVEVK